MAVKITQSRNISFGLGALYLFLALPAVRTSLEAVMAVHMLVQIPLLTAIGIIACRLLPIHWQDSLLDAMGGAIPCVLLAIFASSYWMLPRAMDAALANPLAEVAKFISLPVLVGLPLSLAWKQLSAIGRGFVLTNFISMMSMLGWLYIEAPVRVCNYYLVNQQTDAGWMMVKISILLIVGWMGSLFCGGDPMKPGSD